MKLAIATLKSASAYSQSQHYEIEKQRSETYMAFEQRTWRNRLHVNEDGFVFIPPMSFKNCLSEAAKYLSRQIPGKGKATYTKHFEAGIIVMDPTVLAVKAEDVASEALFVPSNGVRGDGNRVTKIFPVIPNWSGVAKFYIVDEIVNEDVFAEHLKWAGQIIGIGRFRPRNNGFYGRFTVEKVEWKEVEL